MIAYDLHLITQTAKIYPDLLPHMLVIYRIGYEQAKVDSMKTNINEMWGINYGNEMINSN